MLIKNIDSNNTTNQTNGVPNEFCLFSLKNLGSKIFSIECQILLKLKKLNPNIVHLNSFLWYWLNESQIKNAVDMCLSPIETSIISEDNNKIDYFGFTELRKCYTDDDMALGVINTL